MNPDRLGRRRPEPGDILSIPVDRVGPFDVCIEVRVLQVWDVPDDKITDDDRAAAAPSWTPYVLPYMAEVLDRRGERLHYRFVVNVSPVTEEHRPVCQGCGDPWPCRSHSIDVVAERGARSLADACVVCNLPIGGSRSADVKTETPDGLTTARYHTRKGSPCRRAYLLAVASDPEALAGIQREDAAWASAPRIPLRRRSSR